MYSVWMRGGGDMLVGAAQVCAFVCAHVHVCMCVLNCIILSECFLSWYKNPDYCEA
jgi:hypothetical protein